MQEYFDHHLRGHPAPDWMKNGVRYVDRETEKRKYLPKQKRVTAETEVAEATSGSRQ